MNTKTIQRRYDLDWLRVFAILSIFVYHSTRFFDPWFWHIKNPVTSELVGLLQNFMTVWMMPFIFLISGASIFYAMNKGGAGTFFKDKALRLLVPLLVAVFTYSPLQVYLERLTHGQFHGSFWAFLPHYFEGIYLGDGSAGNFAFFGMHMWYVFFLLIYCLIFYPLFRWMKGRGRGALDRIADIVASPWTSWLVLAFPILILHLFVSDSGLEFGAGGWPFLYYPFFLIYGFVIASSERLQTNLKRMRWYNLIVSALLTATYITLLAFPALDALEDALADMFWILSACSLLPTFLGFGVQHLNFTNPFHKYASEAVMGFYILHQTILLIVGYFIVGWTLPAFGKWAVIASTSFVIIMALYEFVVRRVNIMRFLFGMKTMSRSSVARPVDAQIAKVT
ncbi:MAG: acyltransferase family protein [Chloroflexi bacterium]|nr:acyltransferase family protein [Chloroflexota bacterium]